MSVLVIGVGNPDRGDDGVGWRVAELLSDDMDTMCSSGDPASLIEAWSNRTEVIVIDATRTGVPPGTVTIGLPGELPETVTSSHGFGLSRTISLAKSLGTLPPDLTIIGVEGGCFEHGAPLGAAVESAAMAVASRIRAGMAYTAP